MIAKKLFGFLVVSLVVILSGCAGVYQQPSVSEPTSRIGVKNTRTGLATWTNLKVQAIDNKSSGLQLVSSSTLRIHPGKHIFTIFVNFNNGFFSNGPFEAIVDVGADLRANQVYRVQAEVIGSRVLVWISDSSGKRISQIISSSYHTDSAPMPIFVPVGH